MERVVPGTPVGDGARELTPGGDDRFALAHAGELRAASHRRESKAPPHGVDLCTRDAEELTQQRTSRPVPHKVLEERLLRVPARRRLQAPGDLIAVIVDDELEGTFLGEAMNLRQGKVREALEERRARLDSRLRRRPFRRLGLSERNEERDQHQLRARRGDRVLLELHDPSSLHLARRAEMLFGND